MSSATLPRHPAPLTTTHQAKDIDHLITRFENLFVFNRVEAKLDNMIASYELTGSKKDVDNIAKYYTLYIRDIRFRLQTLRNEVKSARIPPKAKKTILLEIDKAIKLVNHILEMDQLIETTPQYIDSIEKIISLKTGEIYQKLIDAKSQ